MKQMLMEPGGTRQEDPRQPPNGITALLNVL